MKKTIFTIIATLFLSFSASAACYVNGYYKSNGTYVSGYYKASYKYDLFAVCNHSGVTQGGHYTATIKDNNN